MRTIPGPLNKYLYTINCAFVSVHRCRPSARAATPMQGVAINLRQLHIFVSICLRVQNGHSVMVEVATGGDTTSGEQVKMKIKWTLFFCTLNREMKMMLEISLFSIEIIF